MSSALHRSIYDRLAGNEVMTSPFAGYQTDLAALLGTDPDTTEPCVYYGDTNDSAQPQDTDGQYLSCITFRPGGGSPDGRFFDGLAIGNGLYDFEFWDYSRSGTVITDIATLVKRLLDRRLKAPVLALETDDRTENVWFEAFTELTVFPDTDRNGWAGLIRYRVIQAQV